MEINGASSSLPHSSLSHMRWYLRSVRLPPASTSATASSSSSASKTSTGATRRDPSNTSMSGIRIDAVPGADRSDGLAARSPSDAMDSPSRAKCTPGDAPPGLSA